MSIIIKIKKWFISLFKTKEVIKPIVKRKKTLEEKLFSANEETRQAYYRHLAEKQETTIEHTRERVANNDYEKKDFQRKIRFEFVPYNQSNRNVRSYLEYKTGDYKKWQSIRNYIEFEADSVCSICGKSSTEYAKTYHTDCHEVWYYDYKTRMQKLKRLEALCIVCHNIKHANQHKKDNEYFLLLMQVYSGLNGIDLEQAYKEYDDNINVRYSRNNIKYKLDLSYLKTVDENVDIFDCHTDEFNKFLNTWNKEDEKKD